MKNLKHQILFFLLVVICKVSFAQEVNADSTTPSLQKNILYGSLDIAEFQSLCISYERKILDKSFYQRPRNIYAGISGGVFAEFMGSSGLVGKAAITWVYGLGKNHFEYKVGIITYYDFYDYREAMDYWPDWGRSKPKRSDYSEAYPLLSFGYRYQNPEGNFLFRTGLGFPEGLYLGLGKAF